MGILDKLKPQPRWKHADPAIRLEALRELTDPVELATMADSDPDAKVRRAAIDVVSDPAVLGRVTTTDADQALKDAAADRLLALATDPANPTLSVAAAGLLADNRRLATVAKSAAADAVREVALSRLSDERSLGGVARQAKGESTALAACARLTSADELLDTTLNSAHKDVALAAFDRLAATAATPLAEDAALLKTIESRSQQKAVARRAKTMLQAIEDAEAARRAAEEELRRQEALLCDTVEGLTDISDPDRTEADLTRISAAWQALSGPDAAAARRFASGEGATRARISQRRNEIEAAVEKARRRGEALASREALCQRVETIEGDDIIEQLVPIEEEWAQLTPLVGNGPEADQLASRFAQAVGACRKRHALGAALQETRASLETLVVEAEALPAQEDEAAAGRWQALSRDARAMVATLADASRPATDLADRLAVVSRAFEAREAAAREAAEKSKLDLAVKLQRLAERAKRTAESETITLREGERVLRDVMTALEEVGSGDHTKEVTEAIAALRVQQETVAPRVKHLRDMDDWRRFANAQQQEQLIAMAEAIVASLKVEEEAGKTAELAATAKALREFHLRWQEVADAPRHSAQRLWDRFKTATDFIRSRCEIYFAKLREECGINVAAKAALVEQAEALATSTDWAKTAAKFQELQKAWQETGPVPRDAARDLAQQFRAACNTFFTQRRDDLVSKKKEWSENLARKEALCVRAEELAESTEWDAASSEMKRLQADWKTIGPVRHNKSEVIWNRFRDAADKFFERYYNRHQIAAAEKIAEHVALVVSLETLAAGEEAPEDLAAQVQTLRTIISKAPVVVSPEMKELHGRWKAALATLVAKWPAAFAGTDLDPAAIHERMEKLIAKVEALIKEEKPAAASNKSATELLAERLRSALASNAMGHRADDSKWRAAGETVEEAQDAWQRIAPVPSEDTHALEGRFKAACKRVMEQVKLHVSAPVGGPGGGFGGGRPGGRPGPGSRVQGPGSGRGPGSGGRDGGRGPRPTGPSNRKNDAQPVGA
ncbi:MAG: DUF349 domain-containing protein [Acidobacteria bacterium]|nr:DUF349 domain-containing protein [Acidobacteriota bacterium]